MTTSIATQIVPHLIGGEPTRESARSQPVYSPATGEEIRQVPLADTELLNQAVATAAQAQKSWRSLGLAKRSLVFFRLAAIIRDEQEDLARIITEEHGKTIPDALGEIARGLENVEFCAGLMHHLKGENAEQVASGVDVQQLKQPVGVVACITPFNFPAMVPLWMISTAIAAGNAVILKPSERDPSATVWIAEAFQRAGLPDGILNVVHGDKDTVNAILEHPVIRAVSFVGSTPIAKHIYSTAALHGKRVQALGGAKNHMVVMPDADLDSAADAAISAGFGSAGQRCMAVSVLVAVGDIADDLIERITLRMNDLKLGNGAEADTDIGPLITRQAQERADRILDSAPGEGATIVVDGRTSAQGMDGFFVGASLVDNVQPGMQVYDEEIFAPVLSVVRVNTYEEAVELINSNNYANGVALFTRDGRTAREFQMDIEVGMVGINVPIPVPIGAFSFGGWKDSLFGDTHMYGPESFNFYTRSKVITSRWPLPDESQIELGFPTH
ncbi:CoA-acylating methylmalonate-semialdehyde dehydrogenase [uncultured Corynebacterium sp.]|uniref:CoA-acylating methylmalonate-semialdehyde dehydrogenase n=1 Tax=uncultured Corynebacterium sp. TaxID=159447 RepID=UPI0025D3A6EA|nr:CoA-acylating methylmalonate-semialdehyde dehydrogenase [uncultured Corynebacterium sp.]